MNVQSTSRWSKTPNIVLSPFPVCLCQSNQKPQNKVIPPLGLFYSWLFSPLSSSTFLPKNWNKWNIRKFLSISKNDFYILLLVLKTTVLNPKKNLICVLTENRSIKSPVLFNPFPMYLFNSPCVFVWFAPCRSVYLSCPPPTFSLWPQRCRSLPPPPLLLPHPCPLLTSSSHQSQPAAHSQ